MAMSPSATELLLRINGQAAFEIEFGVGSPQADEGRSPHTIRNACQESNVVSMFPLLSSA